MSKICVTGGAGFIGSHIVEGFCADGHEVHILDDLSSGKKENLHFQGGMPKNVSLHVLDIRTPEARDLVRELRPELLIHTAAQMSVRVSMERPVFDTEVNVVGVVNLLDAFRGEKAPHFVFLSTGGAIYGEQDVFPADETHPIRPTSVYGLAKRVGEMYLDLWAREFGVRFTALRLANVYGPRQNPHGEAGVVAIFHQRLLRGEVPSIFGSGAQTRDFVYVKDVAAAARTVCEKQITGIFNIGTGVETSVNSLYEQVCKSLGVTVKPEYHPSRAGEQQRSCIDPGLAKKTFGWQPGANLAQGMQQTSEWFRKALGS